MLNCVGFFVGYGQIPMLLQHFHSVVVYGGGVIGCVGAGVILSV